MQQHPTQTLLYPKEQPARNDSWQHQLQDMITSPETLFELLELPARLLPDARAAAGLFPLRVTRAFAARMVKGDVHDPLLRQVLPLSAEHTRASGFELDPLGEANSNPLTGLIHKYHGRVLLIAAPHCAIHCRYCFRRHFNYEQNTPSRQQWQKALAYIRTNPEIDEVILSGGDPLALSDNQLQWLLEQIDSIPSVTRIRIHSRLPIVLPARINNRLINTLSALRCQAVLVIHCNHAQEIDSAVENALAALDKAGITLLNQTVLLKSVNDSANILTTLSKRLFSCRVLPYYLHLLDRVAGTAHFEVSQTQACTLRDELLARLPGYLVPKLVKEEPGADSKTPLV